MISRNGSHPLAQSNVTFLCEIKGGQSHQRRSVHAGSGHANLAHQAVAAWACRYPWEAPLYILPANSIRMEAVGAAPAASTSVEEPIGED